MAIGKFDAPAKIEQFHRDRPISNLMILIWQSRKDLQRAFDLQTMAGQEGYIAWYDVSVGREYGITPSNTTESAKDSSDCNAGQASKPPSHSLYLRLRGLEPRLSRASQWLPVIVRNKARHVWLQLMTKAALATTGSARSQGERLQRDETKSAPPELQQYEGYPGVNIIGYARTESGMGEHVRMSAAALAETDVPFSVVNFDVGIPSRQKASLDHESLCDSNKYKTNLFHVNADQMLATYLHFGKSFFEQRCNIGYPFWELSRFPQEWVPPMQLLDEVWAPSTFIQEALTCALGKSVPYMPVSIVLPKIYKFGRKHFCIPLDRYLFFSTFDFFSYIDRKNPWAAVAAFMRAFPIGSEKVGLVIKVMNADESSESWKRLVCEIGGDKRIRLINETMDKVVLLSLKSECDCYISLHRAEGLGRGPLEAMLLGKPVIVTNYSGNTDYTKPDNSCLVNFSLIPVQEGQYLFHENQVWADPDVEHAAWYMKRLVKDPVFGISLGEKSADFVSAHFSPARCGHLYKQRLKELGML